MKQLSIITICFNEPNLEETCESIVNQTWQDFEWIVIDGGSNKETLNIFEKYKYRIDKFVSEPDNGIYNACNKGIKLATGKYLNFMNAGDSFYHNEILKIFNCISNTTSSDVYYGECELVLNDKNKSLSHFPNKISSVFFILSNICTQGMFIDKKLFDLFGGFCENYKACADYEKWLQFFTNQINFEYLPIIVAKYDLNGISSNKKTQNLTRKERTEICSNYFSIKEIAMVKNNIKTKYSFLEQLFSIKNSKAGSHKIITFLGCHLKIKRSHK